MNNLYGLTVYGPTLRMVESAQAAGFASRVHGWSMREIVATLPPSVRDLGRQIILDKAGIFDGPTYIKFLYSQPCEEYRSALA